MMKCITAGSDKKLITAANPEIFFKTKTKAQINNNTNPTFISMATRNPKEVATPFPPLNALNMENMCPTNKKNDITYIDKSP